jgi:N-acetyl-anhydromuramyl-L-alanine amidase AmpD
MPKPYETESWPFMQAKYFGVKRTGTVRLAVIHDMEFPEKITAAEDVARYFQNPDPGTKPSSHICVDSDSIIQCVKDSFVANAAPGANHDGIQIELAGYGSQTSGQWRDKYSIAMLAVAADAVAQYCLKYDLPAVHLSDAELKAGKKGIVGHDQVSRVYQKSDHTDPGPNFPWPRFITMVQSFIDERR